jgi:hypothetical protein
MHMTEDMIKNNEDRIHYEMKGEVSKKRCKDKDNLALPGDRYVNIKPVTTGNLRR